MKNRKELSNWDNRWIMLAETVSTWSKDDNRKVGAVIVDDRNAVVSLGWNGVIRGVTDTEERYSKEEKSLWVEHAERNALYNAASTGTSVKGCTLYTTYHPCAQCARGIIQSGITTIVTPLANTEHHTWGKEVKIALDMFNEAGVSVIGYVDDGKHTNTFNGCGIGLLCEIGKEEDYSKCRYFKPTELDSSTLCAHLQWPECMSKEARAARCVGELTSRYPISKENEND